MAVEPIYKAIGAGIRTKRRALEWAQDRLAARLGLSRATLANIELGRQRILVHQLYAVADALELTPADLLPPAALAAERTDLPLPDDLSPQQRAQLAQLIEQVPTPTTLSEGSDGAPKRQIPRTRSK